MMDPSIMTLLPNQLRNNIAIPLYHPLIYALPRILLHHQLQDHISAKPTPFKLYTDWIISAEEHQQVLAKCNQIITQNYNAKAHRLPNIPIESTFAIHDQSKTKCWWSKTGAVVEIIPKCQYQIKVDGSKRVTPRVSGLEIGARHRTMSGVKTTTPDVKSSYIWQSCLVCFCYVSFFKILFPSF